MLKATGVCRSNVGAVLDEVAALDEAVENDAVKEVAAVLAFDARCNAPVVIAKGWLPVGKQNRIALS